MHQKDPELMHVIAGILKNATNLIAFTGAGISVASGIPAFTSTDGIWTKYDPIKTVTRKALRINSRGVWEFLLDALSLFERTVPNEAHNSLVQFESSCNLKHVITQNIDGLHQAAGSTDVLELHGGCKTFTCTACTSSYTLSDALNLTPDTLPWTCKCGGVIRPDFVFFDEVIPDKNMGRAQRLVRLSDVMLIVGTSGEVPPANTLPRLMKENGGTVVEINPSLSGFGGVSDFKLFEKAEVALPQLCELIETNDD